MEIRPFLSKAFPSKHPEGNSQGQPVPTIRKQTESREKQLDFLPLESAVLRYDGSAVFVR
jgi:hypothetical protein